MPHGVLELRLSKASWTLPSAAFVKMPSTNPILQFPNLLEEQVDKTGSSSELLEQGLLSSSGLTKGQGVQNQAGLFGLWPCACRLL